MRPVFPIDEALTIYFDWVSYCMMWSVTNSNPSKCIYWPFILFFVHKIYHQSCKLSCNLYVSPGHYFFFLVLFTVKDVFPWIWKGLKMSNRASAVCRMHPFFNAYFMSDSQALVSLVHPEGSFVGLELKLDI